MGAIYPHIYFVTLDTSLKDRLKYQNSTAITAVEAFKKELDRVSTMKSKYHRFAKKVDEKCGKGMVVHHPPL